jgi:UDP-glucose 4-epimerase
MKKAVVVGGSGFVGSHVADFLSHEGFQVVIYDLKESKWLREDQEMVVGSVLDEALKIVLKDTEVVYNFQCLKHNTNNHFLVFT